LVRSVTVIILDELNELSGDDDALLRVNYAIEDAGTATFTRRTQRRML